VRRVAFRSYRVEHEGVGEHDGLREW
jgi:hypothetical protein